MAKLTTSTKRLQINKASTVMMSAVAVCSFIVVFSLVASKSLLSQRAYQSRVIAKKEKTRDQLKKNIDASSTLVTAYKAFVSTPQNIIGGNSTGTGDRDGDNAKIVLDALPSKYDFPALASSLDKILSGSGLTVNNISGTDDEISHLSDQSSNNPQSVEMPFDVSVTGTYTNVQALVGTFENSIRPFYIDSLTFSGNDNQLQLDVKAKTYYQPEKNLTINKVVVK